MSDRVKVELIGDKELHRLFVKMTDPDRNGLLLDTVEAGGRVVEAYAKVNTNNVFSDKSLGNLSASITVEKEYISGGAEATIGPTVVYGRIHELGGTILPVFAKMLHWIDDNGKDVFAKVVHMPARPYLRPAMDDHITEIVKAMERALEKGIKRIAGIK